MNRPLLIAIGVALGLALARYVVFDVIEVMAWQMFWSGLAEGEVAEIGAVLQSATFWKSFGCAAVGAIGGSLLWDRMKSTDEPDDDD